jgi:hypothetical protein
MSIDSIKIENILNAQGDTGLPACLPPNQSLKLTEPAVDDFARAKHPATVGRDLPRADWIPLLRHFVAAA